MKTIALIIAFAAAAAADGLHSHGGSSVGRRGRAGRRGGRLSARRGRQEAAAGGYAAPADDVAGGYAAPSDDVPVYAEEELGGYVDGAASDSGDPALDMLQSSIPGVPGEDYPIYSEVPETAFACDGQVDGGYYADPEAECQAFHICTADGAGGLAKYSFLCPNGTLFNQNYFICDWWFNFDCSTAEDLYSLNDEIAAEREALAGAASDAVAGYEAPAEYAPAADYADYEAAAADYAAEEVDYGYEAPAPVPAPVTEAADYELYDDAGALGVYGEETTAAPVDSYLPPVEGRRGRAGRRQGRRQGRRGGRRNQRRPSQGRRQFRG